MQISLVQYFITQHSVLQCLCNVSAQPHVRLLSPIAEAYRSFKSHAICAVGSTVQFVSIYKTPLNKVLKTNVEHTWGEGRQLLFER